MIKNKLTRKLRQALALATIMNLGYAPNGVISAIGLNPVNLTPADLADLVRKVFYTNEGTKRYTSLNGGQRTCSWKTITKVGDPVDKIFIVAAEYKDDTMDSGTNVIFVNERNDETNILNGTISVLPYDTTIVQKLAKYYDKLGPDYSLPANEEKWWTHTKECIDHLVALSVADKDSTEFENLCARYGLTPGQGMAIGLTTAVLLAGGIIWAFNKTIKTVGAAAGNIIHGNTNTDVPQPIIMTAPSQAPASIIINNN